MTVLYAAEAIPVIDSSRPFSFWLKQGATEEELKKHYAMSDREYIKVITCLEAIRGGKQ